MNAPAARHYMRDQEGAVAATIALLLFVLIGMGGVAFDYARMATMDSELQNAADQAALAAATQLDGGTDACARAAAAAAELVANRTQLANDEAGPEITLPNEDSCDATGQIRFYEDKAKTTPATTDADAHFVEVTVNPREAFYAFTPLVGAFSSGDMTATAFAGLGSSICKVPPVMMCNPHESTDPDFTIGNYIGAGIRLVANDGGGGYGPGNFGYLDNSAGSGANVLKDALGNVSVPGNCTAIDDVSTKPGENISVLDALNTRFDIYANGLTSTCGADGSLCPPSANARKDVMKSGNGCAFSPGNGGNGWKLAEAPYLPASATPLTTAQISGLSPMGYPRDMCHAVSQTGNCAGGRIGNGQWDRNAYFRTNSTNYPVPPTTGDLVSWFGTDQPTRYQVYRWEMDNAATRLQSQSQNGRTAHGQPVCMPPGLVPGGSIIDRRRLSVAVINCAEEGVSGNTNGVHVTKWVEIFLVEPSLPRARTESSDVYVEVIGATDTGGGGAAGQTVRRDVPYLIE